MNFRTSSPARYGAAVLVGLAFSPLARAQVSHGGEPAGWLNPIADPAPLVEVAPPDVAAYLAEDEASNHRPLRYGALLELTLDMDAGSWTALPDGSRAWRVRIGSEGAHSLALEFASFQLPTGAAMYVYREGEDSFLGGYTYENQHPGGGFVFEPYAGSEFVLEIDVPEGAPDPWIETAAVIYDYRDVFGLMNGTITVSGSPSTAADCLIDVNCPQGDPWDVQKRATMRTLSNGALCSGALLNNTAEDGTGYVLTADHCGQTSNTVFLFRYERPDCSSGVAPTNMTVSGATVLTTSGTFDNRFLRVEAAIPDSYEPYYVGWSRSSINSDYAFAMGHPSGGPKKISIDSDGSNRELNFWRVFWNEGTLEGGSSGGPLFDELGRVRGPACCVDAFVCLGQTAWFGRFDRFYASNGIAQWLDPLGLDPLEMDGFDPFCPLPYNYCTSTANSTGLPGRIAALGSRRISVNDFTLMAYDCPPGQPGVFYYGPSETSVPFGNGTRCAGGTTTRLPVLTIDPFGSAFDWLDFPNLPATGAIQAGDTAKFQFWFRDPAAGGAAFDLTDGLSATFCP